MTNSKYPNWNLSLHELNDEGKELETRFDNVILARKHAGQNTECPSKTFCGNCVICAHPGHPLRLNLDPTKWRLIENTAKVQLRKFLHGGG